VAGQHAVIVGRAERAHAVQHCGVRDDERRMRRQHRHVPRDIPSRMLLKETVAPMNVAGRDGIRKRAALQAAEPLDELTATGDAASRTTTRYNVCRSGR